jgi:hypothetical protein
MIITYYQQNGATIGIRTRDLFLTMEALYRLSYRGMICDSLLYQKLIRGESIFYE